MYTYIYIHICIHIHTYMYTYIYMHIFINVNKTFYLNHKQVLVTRFIHMKQRKMCFSPLFLDKFNLIATHISEREKRIPLLVQVWLCFQS